MKEASFLLSFTADSYLVGFIAFCTHYNGCRKTELRGLSRLYLHFSFLIIYIYIIIEFEHGFPSSKSLLVDRHGRVEEEQGTRLPFMLSSDVDE